MPAELIVPRKKTFFQPVEEGRFIPISEDVADIWRQPHIRVPHGKVEGFVSGWRSGLSYAGGELYKFKGCRPTGKVWGGSEPEGSQTYSLAQYEVEAVLAHREVYLREGLPYPLEPVGFWVYDGYQHDGEPNAATLYKAAGDTRLDEFLWWIEKDLPFQYISDGSREAITKVMGQFGIRLGRILRLAHDGYLTWDAGEGASNAHLGNVVLFPHNNLVAVAGVDFDNSLRIQDGVETDDENLDLSKIRRQDLVNLTNSIYERRVVSSGSGFGYEIFGITDKLVDRMLKKVAPELAAEDTDVRNYLLDHFGNRVTGSLRFFLGVTMGSSYDAGGSWQPLGWDDLLDLRRFVESQKRDFVQKVESRFKREEVDRLVLSAKKHSIFRGLHYPLVIDPENINLTEQASAEVLNPSELTDEEVLKLTRKLLESHQTFINQFPAQGKDYFSFPKVSQEVSDTHSSLSKQEVKAMIRYWVEGSLKAAVSKQFTPRSIGSFLLALTQINFPSVAEAIKEYFPAKDDPDLSRKFSRINEFFALLPSGVKSRDFNFGMYLYQLIGDRSQSFNLGMEAGYRSAIALFGYGIVDENLEEIFNHLLLPIILNEFGEDQAAALTAALDCPEILDPINKGAPENALCNAQIALTGAQVRGGRLENLSPMDETNEVVTGEFRSAILQYFFASHDKDEIKNPALREVLRADIGEGWVATMVGHLLSSGKQLNPDSFFADSVRKTSLKADDMARILKTALDTLDGDLSKLNPVVMSALERSRKGSISEIEAAELVFTCIGLGIDLPPVLEAYLTESDNQKNFMNFLSIRRIFATSREKGIYGTSEPYPINPIYSLMSQGTQALPKRLRAIYEEHGENQEVVNQLAAGLLDYLFTDDYAKDTYFRCYFGGMLGSNGYPQTELNFGDLGEIKVDGKRRWQFWRIVHPDIWRLIALADTKILKDYVKTKLPQGTVKMDLGIRRGMFSFRDSYLYECLPPFLYRIIQKD